MKSLKYPIGGERLRIVYVNGWRSAFLCLLSVRASGIHGGTVGWLAAVIGYFEKTWRLSFICPLKLSLCIPVRE